MTTDQMLVSIPIVGGAIEDLFSKNDYKKWILKDESVIFEGKNSDYGKTKTDKVLVAKLFLGAVNSLEVAIDDETRGKAGKLFSVFYERFRSY